MPRTKQSYAAKTGQNARGTEHIVNALFGKGPAFIETANGFTVRDWQPADLLKWTYDELKSVLVNRVGVETDELLAVVPPSAIKWSVNKGWLVQRGTSGFYFITAKAALDLDLPARFRGIHGNRRIPFIKAPAPATRATKRA